MDSKVALVIALTARLEQFFHTLPPESEKAKKSVLLYSSYVLDHSKPQAMLAASPRLKGETAVQFLVRFIDRIKTVPEYRWPKPKGEPQHVPQVAYATTAALHEILRGKKLAPGVVLELVSWIEPVWEVYPTLKEPALAAIREAATAD